MVALEWLFGLFMIAFGTGVALSFSLMPEGFVAGVLFCAALVIVAGLVIRKVAGTRNALRGFTAVAAMLALVVSFVYLVGRDDVTASAVLALSTAVFVGAVAALTQLTYAFEECMQWMRIVSYPVWVFPVSMAIYGQLTSSPRHMFPMVTCALFLSFLALCLAETHRSVKKKRNAQVVS